MSAVLLRWGEEERDIIFDAASGDFQGAMAGVGWGDLVLRLLRFVCLAFLKLAPRIVVVEYSIFQLDFDNCVTS